MSIMRAFQSDVHKVQAVKREKSVNESEIEVRKISCRTDFPDFVVFSAF